MTDSQSLAFQVREPPVITVKPQAHLQQAVGAPISLDCMVTGSPKPAVYWTLEQDESLSMVMPGTRLQNMYVASDGALKIEEPGMENSGHYACSALNEVGSAMARSHLVIYDPQDFNSSAGEGEHEKLYHATSDYDPESEAARLGLLERTVVGVKAEALGPTSIQITWNLAAKDINSPSNYVDGFHVHHR